MNASETYLLVDVEADGPVPGRHSMLSFAAVAFKLDRTIIGTFERNLSPLPDARQYEPTMIWWKKFPEAWAACQVNQVAPEKALPEFMEWVKQLPDQPVIFCAAPIGFDWIYMYHYMHLFTDYTHSISEKSPFFLLPLDLPSYGAALINKPFRYCGKPSYPKSWKEHGLPHTHRAIDDAMGHAMTFCAMTETATELHRLAKLGKTVEAS